MELKSLLVDTKTVWVEFPGLDGFEVELANLSRKELVALRKRCTINKFNRKTRAFEESLDDDRGMLFVFKEEDYHGMWMKNTKIPLDCIC